MSSRLFSAGNRPTSVREARTLAILLAALSAMGPFAVDTYLPAFPSMAGDLNTSVLQIQQTLPAYMLPFAFMMFWHGPVSDAVGRRPVILVALALFSLASLLCALAPSVEWLWLGRGLQGLVGGVGMVISRAMVRDLFDGVDAQRLMATVMVMFGIAPAIAPVIGGMILLFADWRGIFIFLMGFAALMWLAVWRWLPETLPRERRHRLHGGELMQAYLRVLRHHVFRRLALAVSFNFIGLFLYVLAAPVFLMQHLGLSAQGFAWMFVPVVGGMMVGSALSGRMAGRHTPHQTIVGGFISMAGAAVLNLVMCLLWPATLWNILPLVIYCAGMSLVAPSLQLLALDLFPERRGLASSCLGVAQTAVNAVAAALLVPLLWGSPLHLALGMAGALLLGALTYWLSTNPLSRPQQS
jgi:DHA1 family bicyclomycin/chloramphenicol resistance-like MFS transporter